MRKVKALGVFLCIGMLMATSSSAAEWGDLTARFVFDGDPPKPRNASITANKEYCCQHEVLDESLLVNKENGGIANVVMFLYVGRSGKRLPVHPSYSETEKEEVFLDNSQCRFDPHVVLLRTTQTLVLGNTDAISHNVNCSTFRNKPFNVTMDPGARESFHFQFEEPAPVRVACNIHPWMGAYLFIKDGPYMAVSDANGKLTIRNLPVGKVTFRVWHEEAGRFRAVSVNGKPADWEGKPVTLDIQPGQNDLGEIKIPASSFD